MSNYPDNWSQAAYDSQFVTEEQKEAAREDIEARAEDWCAAAMVLRADRISRDDAFNTMIDALKKLHEADKLTRKEA